MIYSTTYVRLPDGTGYAGREFWTQLYALGLGSVALLVCLTIDYRLLAEHSLLSVCRPARRCWCSCWWPATAPMGAQRWIALGPFKLQPSEFARMTLALILAMFFGENRRGARNTSDLVIGGIFVVVPFLLIVKQPDLGLRDDAAAGLPRRRLSGRAAAAAARRSPSAIAILLAPIAWNYGLKDYQKSRIVIFIDPEQDPRGAGLSADSGARHRRIRRPEGQGLHAGHAGPVQVPAGRAQRFHLLGARGGARVPGRARARSGSICS